MGILAKLPLPPQIILGFRQAISANNEIVESAVWRYFEPGVHALDEVPFAVVANGHQASP